MIWLILALLAQGYTPDEAARVLACDVFAARDARAMVREFRDMEECNGK